MYPIREYLEGIVPPPVADLMPQESFEAAYTKAVETATLYLAEPGRTDVNLTEGEAWYCVAEGLRSQTVPLLQVKSPIDPPGLTQPTSLGTIVALQAVVAQHLAAWCGCIRAPRVPGGSIHGATGGWSFAGRA